MLCQSPAVARDGRRHEGDEKRNRRVQCAPGRLVSNFVRCSCETFGAQGKNEDDRRQAAELSVLILDQEAGSGNEQQDDDILGPQQAVKRKQANGKGGQRQVLDV